MLVDALLTNLLGSLSNPMLDVDLVKQGIKLLLYNAETFLQIRRVKLLKEQEIRQGSPKEKTDLAAESKPSQAELETPSPKPAHNPICAVDQPLRITPDLSEFWIRTAENEIDSLLRQLETHFRMLALQQEQLANFGEYAPPYMRLGIQNEQREIIHIIQRLSGLMKQIYGTEYPAVDQLNQLL